MTRRRHDAPSERPLITPWREAVESESESLTAVEARIAAVFAQVPPPPSWGAGASARVLARLTSEPRLTTDARSRRGVFERGFRFVRFAAGSTLGLALLSLSGGVIAAGGAGAWWRLSHPKPAGVAGPAPSAKAGGHHAKAKAAASAAPLQAALSQPQGLSPIGPLSSLPSPLPAAPAEAPAPSAPSSLPDVSAPLPFRPLPAPRPRHEPPRSGALAPAAAPSQERLAASAFASPGALGQETALLRKALVDLRLHRDGAAALVTLDQYLALFPRGTLADEARRGRVDALLMLGRDAEALQALDELELSPVGRGLELRLIRGELRAAAGCVGATADFDAVLARVPGTALAERALWGRALCHQRLGRHDLAAADGAAYLTRFPQGRFAAAVRRLATSGAPP